MNWKTYWEKHAQSNQIETQVQRKSQYEFKEAADWIIKNAKISENQEVLDVCCGNGLITNYIADHCHEVKGIDFSSTLIQQAQQSFPNVSFLEGDVLHLTDYVSQDFDVIYCEFSFQYFTNFESGRKLVNQMLKCLKPDGCIFLGNIPDYARRWKHYDTFLKKFFYYKHSFSGKLGLGKLWKESELSQICKDLDCSGQRIDQPESMPYSHYRFDYLIRRRNSK